ncbi:MAG TPA: hypothetical protein DCX03_02575 [Bacteroidales bacterium]|jgi:hypothetical protein|nr:hypothetical protein [Bacteroidales bacterium]
MKSKLLLTKFIEEILSELNRLSDSDVCKLEEGGYSISLKILKNKAQRESNIEITDSQKDKILKELQLCKTREEGYEILSKYLNSKKEFEAFARFLDISVLKQDKADKIKAKIIESTVGAILRSNAIQGKTT